MIGTDFGFFDSISIDAQNNLSVVFEFLEETNLEVWEKSGESASCMLVIYQFATKLDIEFVEHLNTFFDFLFLDFSGRCVMMEKDFCRFPAYYG